MSDAGPDTALRLPDGVRLHVEEYGAADAALTVVFVHGWTLDLRLWRSQLADLPGSLNGQVRIVAFDLRGHGRSSATARRTTTLAHLADDIAAVVTERAPTGRVVLVGHSMGGMAIMEYAHRHPQQFADRVGGVVFIATSAQGSMHTTYGVAPPLVRLVRAMEMTGAAVLARSGPGRPHRAVMPALVPGLRWLVFGSGTNRDAVRLAASMIGSARLAAIGGFRPWIDQHDRVDALAAMQSIPVTVIAGTRDRLTPVRCATTIVAALPRAHQEIYPGAGHILPLECPDQVTGAIVRVCAEALADMTRPSGRSSRRRAHRTGALAARHRPPTPPATDPTAATGA